MPSSAAPHHVEAVSLAASEEPESLVERGRSVSGSRETGDRLDEQVAAAERPRPAAQMSHRLREGRVRRIAVPLLECGPAERAQTDASKRVAIHVVGFLDRLETAEAGDSSRPRGLRSGAGTRRDTRRRRRWGRSESLLPARRISRGTSALPPRGRARGASRQARARRRRAADRPRPRAGRGPDPLLAVPCSRRRIQRNTERTESSGRAPSLGVPERGPPRGGRDA